MTENDVLVGIDWETGRRSTYVLNGAGELLRRHVDDAVAGAIGGDLEASLRALLQTLQLKHADVLISGQAACGRREAGLLPVAYPLSELPQALEHLPLRLPGVRCRVVPGYHFVDMHGMPDVTCGEETQVFGALQLRLRDGWFLLPGMHSKWVKIEGGRIIEFFSFMSGELYALLTRHGTLADVSSGEASVPEAFADGLQAARHGGITRAACCCRARIATGMMPAAHSASYLSGLLVGSELYDMLRRTPHEMPLPVQVIGGGPLARRYLAALELLGIEARVWQPDGVYVAALRALFGVRA
jgi:2-dehydro-3-deoxygalactonokinase